MQVTANQSMALLNRARDLFNKKEYEKSQNLLNEVIDGSSPEKDKSGLVEAYFLLANIFHMTGEIGKAIKAFNKVLEIDPAHTDSSISLSVLYNDIGHYEDAKRVFEKANERVKNQSLGDKIEDKHVNKKFSAKHYELAELYMTYNRFDEALFEYQKSRALDSENLEIIVKIAKVYAKKGFITKAIDELRKLKNEQPVYSPGRVALGVLYYGQGKVLEAQTEWEKVLSVDPHNAEASMYLNLSRTATETSLS